MSLVSLSVSTAGRIPRLATECSIEMFVFLVTVTFAVGIALVSFEYWVFTITLYLFPSSVRGKKPKNSMAKKLIEPSEGIDTVFFASCHSSYFMCLTIPRLHYCTLHWPCVASVLLSHDVLYWHLASLSCEHGEMM